MSVEDISSWIEENSLWIKDEAINSFLEIIPFQEG
jgi:hypothetical protein